MQNIPRRELIKRMCLGSGVAGLSWALAGCGFELRKPPHFVFKVLCISNLAGTPFGIELQRNLARVDDLEVITDVRDIARADMILDLMSMLREKVIIGRTSTGDIREFQLREKLRFKVRNQAGIEKIPEVELVQYRDISFAETVVLAKEMEEELLYQNMQTDLIAQVMRQLAAIRRVN